MGQLIDYFLLNSPNDGEGQTRMQIQFTFIVNDITCVQVKTEFPQL